MALIFNQQFFASTMMEMSYDANKLPLGKLSKRMLASGFKLKDLCRSYSHTRSRS
jgi:poly [ADP-ribose] polymerase